MDQRTRILTTVGELTASRGRLPSILEVASEIGLTKQGVLHYFPTRAALDAAVVVHAIDRIDRVMREAADAGAAHSPAATYLRLSTPDDADIAAAAVVVAAATASKGDGLPPEVPEAIARWEGLIAREVGDPVRAEVIRLTADGLFAESWGTGRPVEPERVERLIRHLLTPPTERP